MRVGRSVNAKEEDEGGNEVASTAMLTFILRSRPRCLRAECRFCMARTSAFGSGRYFGVGVVDFDGVEEGGLEELSHLLCLQQVVSESAVVYSDARNHMKWSEE